MNNEKETRIKRAMGALENLPKINVSREALDAALEAGEYEEIAAQVARPPEKILSIDAAQELADELKRLRAEVTRLTEWNNNQLETITIQRKIRAYVAFVLTGDELADVQMAADKTIEKLEAAASKLSQLQEQGGKLCCWVGAAMMLSHDVQAAVQKLPANFDMPHSLKVALEKIQEMATDKFGKNVVSAANEEKARKIAEMIFSWTEGYIPIDLIEELKKDYAPDILAILNGGQQ